MGTSVLHIKTEVECKVFLFDEEKGVATIGKYFNLEVRKGEQNLLFVSLKDKTKRYHLLYMVEENDNDYRLDIKLSQFREASAYFLKKIEEAKKGDVNAQNDLGCIYYNGNGVEQNFKDAFHWFSISAEQGYEIAQFNLGVCYENGEGVEQNWIEALKWYRKAAEQGYPEAQYKLGFCYQVGKGVAQNYWSGLKWIRKSAEQGYDVAQNALMGYSYYQMYLENVKEAESGDPDAQTVLGWISEIGGIEPPNCIEAVKWYRKAAEKDSPKAQFQLGECYANGKGVEQNWKEAIKWYRKAAELGYDLSQNNLGVCYAKGKGVVQNWKEAVKWYRKAAEQGYWLSQNNLGVCCAEGKGEEQDFKEAFRLFLKSSESEYSIAQYNLGVCCAKGKGVEQNWEEAVKWFRKAAEQGNSVAQLWLGKCYEDGKGVGKNYIDAFFWYHKAAEQGYSVAQFYLGYCYENGKGVEQNKKKAKKWYSKAGDMKKIVKAIYALSLTCQGINEMETINALYTTSHFPNGISFFPPLKTSDTPFFLFFDTETTGLPKNYDEPASNTKNWPRLVQLAWILTDENGKQLSSHCKIIKPDGFSIPYAAEEVHGISTSVALQKGRPLREVITSFLEDAKLAKYFVGHNIAFDQNIVGAELHRLGINDTISTAPGICTMRETVNFCEIERTDMSYMYDDYDEMYDYDFPSLQDLYMKLFNEEFEDAHDAMADVTATMKCFFELRRIGVLSDDMAGRYNLIDDEDEDDDDILPF